ncbi:hypothetical protein [Microbacterium luticocti]|uniref:hypothetical protein n=1 Tax=Microbacterium luticocti TaxID=451764 RepID=UPI00041D781F|nr:hypothetical protein [Microbacterium luticocti]
MIFDLPSVVMMTAVVVTVTAAVFILETILRRDEGAGRLWSVAFLSGTVSTLAYLVWAFDRGAWWAVAVGNAAYVAVAGLLWLGCRSFNGRRMPQAGALTAVGIVAAGVAALAAGPDGGDWAGAVVMFCGIALFCVLGCVECLRGELTRTRSAWALAAVLGVDGAYFVVRTVVFLAAGPDSDLFRTWFGTVTACVLLVTFTIVSLTVTSVLRAGRTPVRSVEQIARSTGADTGVMRYEQFAIAARGLLTRAAWHDELVAVFAVRIDDLDQISTAFGSEVAHGIVEAWRRGVRRHTPAAARVGEDGTRGLVVATVVLSAAEARRIATTIAQGVFEELRAVPGSVIPVVGVGLALSDTLGDDLDTLLAAARADSAGRQAVADSADGLDPAGL